MKYVRKILMNLSRKGAFLANIEFPLISFIKKPVKQVEGQLRDGGGGRRGRAERVY
jgi:hypothetical protein